MAMGCRKISSRIYLTPLSPLNPAALAWALPWLPKLLVIMAAPLSAKASPAEPYFASACQLQPTLFNQETPMSKGTVLVADDDKAIRTVLTQALGRAGFDVRAASTAASLW